MEKIIPVGSWSFGQEPVELVKISSHGFTDSDKRLFLEKRASAGEFAEQIKQADLKPGDVPIHVIAIGETEKFGPNRNGDGFSRHTCKTAHNTFVKHARYYRHHKKQDGIPGSFGYVKCSSYNPDMGRIELLVVGNGTREAAERNGGKVMLDETLQKLASGKEVPWSMGCKLSFDECSACHKKAASPKEYCKEGECKHHVTGEEMPGCAKGLSKLSKSGFVQFVDNPNPTFHDISEVAIPADRTAYGWMADYLTKSASFDTGEVIGGAKLAELVYQGNDKVIDTGKLTLTKVVNDLAFQEKTASDDDPEYNGMRSHGQVMSYASQLGNMLPFQAHDRIMKLASHGILLSADNYIKANRVKYARYDLDSLTYYVKSGLHDIYSNLVGNANLSGVLEWENVKKAGKRDSLCGQDRRLIREESLTDDNLMKWRKQAVLTRNGFGKTASMLPSEPIDKERVLGVVLDYALYKVAAIAMMDDEVYGRAIKYAVAQNRMF